MSQGQLKTNESIFFSTNGEVKNHKGRVWRAWSEDLLLGAGLHYYFGMQVGPQPIELTQLIMTTDSVLTNMDLYEGGVYSGGAVLPVSSMNRDNLVSLPVLDVKENVTIDTVGTKVFPNYLRGTTGIFGTSETTRSNSSIGLILKRNTTYYFDLFNQDVDAKTYDTYFIMSIHNEPLI